MVFPLLVLLLPIVATTQSEKLTKSGAADGGSLDIEEPTPLLS